MTPEERIQEFVGNHMMPWTLSEADQFSIVAIVRAAENDALETAAAIMESLWAENDKITKPPGWDSLCIRAQSEIRALKT